MAYQPELEPDEKEIWRGRPAWHSFWVFVLGVLVCGVGPFLKEAPPLSPTLGIVFAAIFALIILRRWSNLYILTNRKLLVRGGLFARDNSVIELRDISQVEMNQGMTLRIVGVGHLMVRSHIPNQENIFIYGQTNADGLKDKLERLAEQARSGAQPTDPPS
jgi:uncharacterized membrane protein YdbT with pleckstrin-like domain